MSLTVGILYRRSWLPERVHSQPEDMDQAIAVMPGTKGTVNRSRDVSTFREFSKRQMSNEKKG
jgi:hypothetical protein